MIQSWGSSLVGKTVRRADARPGTYLTVDWPRNIEPDNIENYSDESGYPRKGVKLE